MYLLLNIIYNTFHLKGGLATSALKEVFCPRKFRPREDFPSNRSSELENPNRAGEIYRDGAKFGRRNLQGFEVG